TSLEEGTGREGRPSGSTRGRDRRGRRQSRSRAFPGRSLLLLERLCRDPRASLFVSSHLGWFPRRLPSARSHLGWFPAAPEPNQVAAWPSGAGAPTRPSDSLAVRGRSPTWFKLLGASGGPAGNATESLETKKGASGSRQSRSRAVPGRSANALERLCLEIRRSGEGWFQLGWIWAGVTGRAAGRRLP